MLKSWLALIFILSPLKTFGSEIEFSQKEFMVAGASQGRLEIQNIGELRAEDFSIIHRGLALDKNAVKWMEGEYGRYIFPNETQPELLTAFALKNPDITNLLSVGTERCLLHAVFLEVQNKVFCYDYDHGAVMFGLINLALIQVAQDWKEYKHLRLVAPFASWKAALRRNFSNLSVPQMQTLYRFWDMKVRKSVEMREFYHAPPAPGFFAASNYLYNQSLFNEIKARVERRQFSYSWIDISAEVPMQTLWKAALSSGKNLMDISNIAQHLDEDSNQDLLRRFQAQPMGQNFLLWTVDTSAPLTWNYHLQPVTADLSLTSALLFPKNAPSQTPASLFKIPGRRVDPARIKHIVRLLQ